MKLLKGDIVHAPVLGVLETIPDGALLLDDDGTICEVLHEQPQDFDGEVFDCTGKLIMQSFADMHLHAPQFPNVGTGMDLPLLDWLKTYTFPVEAKFADLSYARRVYRRLARDLIANGTTRVCMFSSLHTDATLVLMEELERAGVTGFVGKVNMDRNGGENLQETTGDSIRETQRWLKECSRFTHIKPILTPRFVPSCSDALMQGLGELAARRGLPVQSHLSENLGEIALVQSLCPQTDFYAEAYDRCGLLSQPCIMAHCVHCPPEEQDLLQARGVFIAHSPLSNSNLSSGIAPVSAYLARGLRVGLGSDLAAGETENLFRVMAEAIRVSKLRWRLADDSASPLTVAQAFYLATRGGGAFFGEVGCFEPGFALDAVVLDDSALVHPQELTPNERLERCIYLADERHIAAKYVAGTRLF